jgi:hypothetical protein
MRAGTERAWADGVFEDRKTPPVDLRGLARQVARDTVRELPAAANLLDSGELHLASVPHVVLAREELLALPLDERFGFILSLIDGQTSVADILDLCSLTRVEVVEMIVTLLRKGVIVLGES